MYEITKSVQEAISKNLPAAVGAELAEYLKQAETDKKALVNLRADLERSQQLGANLSAQLRDQEVFDRQRAQLVTDTAALQARELTLLKQEAQLVAAVATANSDAVLHVVGMFLKLPQVRTTVLSEVAVPVTGSPGGNGNPGYGGTVIPARESHTTTHSQE